MERDFHFGKGEKESLKAYVRNRSIEKNCLASQSTHYAQGNSNPGGSDSKEFTCNSGELSLIPGSERSPGEGNGHSLQYSFLENSLNTEAWLALVYGVTKSQTGLSN